MCDFFGWLGVRLGLLYPDTPALFNLGSLFLPLFLAAITQYNPNTEC